MCIRDRLGSTPVSQDRVRCFDETWGSVVAEELDHRDLLSGSCCFFCRLTHDLSVIVVFPERASNARRHAGNDDADVIGIVRIILRDGGEDVGSGGIQLHQVAGDRRILRVLPAQSCFDLLESFNSVLQAVSFMRERWVDMRVIVVELLKVCLGLFLEARQHDAVRLVARRVVDALKVADDVGAVSYTHLDVYKRQPRTRGSGRSTG